MPGNLVQRFVKMFMELSFHLNFSLMRQFSVAQYRASKF